VLVMRALFSPQTNNRPIVGYVTLLIPATSAIKSVLLKASAHNHTRILAIGLPILRGRVNQGAYWKGYCLTHDDGFTSAKRGQHIE